MLRVSYVLEKGEPDGQSNLALRLALWVGQG